MAISNDQLAQQLYLRVTRFNAAISPDVDRILKTANKDDFGDKLDSMGFGTNTLLNRLTGQHDDSMATLDQMAERAGPGIESWAMFPQLAGLHEKSVGRTLDRIAAAHPELKPFAEAVRASLGNVREFISDVR